MNNSFLGGLLLGFVIVFGIYLVVSIFTRKGNKAHYDERQKIIRGEGYKVTVQTQTEHFAAEFVTNKYE